MYTGDVRWTDYAVTAVLKPVAGTCHQFMARVQGACRCYGARLAEGKLQLVKNVDGRYRVLTERPFSWAPGERLALTLKCAGNRLTMLSADGTPLIDFTDMDSPYLNGAVGAGVERGHCAFDSFEVRPLDL